MDEFKGVAFPNGLPVLGIAPGDVMHHLTPTEADGIAKTWARYGTYVVGSHPPRYVDEHGNWHNDCLTCLRDR
jgi:hypothetical protein